MAYEHFAMLYDDLMSDAPYDQWIDFVKRARSFTPHLGRKVLDLGCGTGEIALRLQSEGFDVTGVDLSEDMLTIAQAKGSARHLTLPLFQQDMRELLLPDRFDMVVIFCDALNYLENPDDLMLTLNSVYEHLNDGGLLLFDCHSLHKVNDGFIDQQFSLSEENIAYIWESFPGPEPDSVYHDLTFFHQLPSGLYERFDEEHFQRTYPIESYLDVLKQTGFQCLNVSADFTDATPSDTSERIFFIAKKGIND